MSFFRKCILFFTIGLLALPGVLFAYVSPGEPTGFVNDYAEVLNVEQQTNLETKLSGFEATSTVEIAVVTIKNLGDETVETYAAEIFKEWGIGKKNKDNGALILVVVDDRKMRIEVGYGLEGQLTDALSGQIIRNIMTPAFRQNDFYQGIDGATSAIMKITAGENVPELAATPTQNNSFFNGATVFFLVFVGLGWLASVFSRSSSWWAGGLVGGIGGVLLGVFSHSIALLLFGLAVLVPLGLLFDYVVSAAYLNSLRGGRKTPWWAGGGRGGMGGGGFGGFGGGSSGGGGASGSW